MLALTPRYLVALALVLGACRGRSTGGVDARLDAVAGTPRGRVVSVVYSSNLVGEYERCGCPVHPLGGLARRAAEVDRIRGESDAVISVDAGDLFLGPTPVGWKAAGAGEVERRARLIAAAYGRMGVTAVSPGESDLALGPALLRGVLADAKVPGVSANLFDLDGERVFPADRLIDVVGVKVGIFGVTAVSPPDPARLRAWGFEARDPAGAARASVASLRARGAKIVIALVHVGGAPDSKQLVRAVPGIDWAVLGHSGMNLETPEAVGGARLLEAMNMGKNVGRLDLHVVAGDGRGLFVERAARAQLQTILADHQHQVAEYERLLPEADKPSMRAYYEKRLGELRRAIARETAELATLPPRVSGNWFENRVLPMDTAVPDQPGVAVLVDAYNRESDHLAAAGKPVGIKPVNPKLPKAPRPTKADGARVAPAVDAPKVTYVGTAACVACHKPADDFWRTTKHAHALETLEKVHRARSPACIGCHATGYLQPGGTADLDVATGRLRDVGCESCHGPGSLHIAAADKKTSIARAVPAAVCLGCHTPDQTNKDFDYSAYLKAITGPGHGAR